MSATEPLLPSLPASADTPPRLALQPGGVHTPSSVAYHCYRRPGPPSRLVRSLFSHAIQYALAAYITRPIAISTIKFSILLATRSLIFELREMKWVLVAAIFFVATLGQTASWTSLFKPIDIIIPTPIVGTEIDLSSSGLIAKFPELWDGTIQGDLNSTSLSTLLKMSGTTSAYSPSGIHRRRCRGPLKCRLKVGYEEYETIPARDVMEHLDDQQGLTATTSCESRVLDANTSPPLWRLAQSAKVKFIFWQRRRNLLMKVGETLRLTTTNDTLFALGCQEPDNRTYSPDYEEMGTVVCEVSPRIQDMITTYSDSDSTLLSISAEPDKTHPPLDTGLVGDALMKILLQTFVGGQSETRNSIAGSIWTLYNSQRPEKVAVGFPQLWKAYIIGVLEFLGTSGGPFGGDPAAAFTKEIRGSLRTATPGWQYTTLASRAILIPSTFVAITSILIVLVIQFLNRRIPPQYADFNATDPVVLMAAASAGGIRDTFHGLARADLEDGCKKIVQLAQTNDRTLQKKSQTNDKDGIVEGQALVA
ncbi:hypothetical protein C8J57DRAFT_1610061 [Mycena rebaudengoi]|nr:hypothetical protein C8J57DRAFT_1610061 [Mycena rebaudengoi]